MIISKLTKKFALKCKQGSPLNIKIWKNSCQAKILLVKNCICLYHEQKWLILVESNGCGRPRLRSVDDRGCKLRRPSRRKCLAGSTAAEWPQLDTCLVCRFGRFPSGRWWEQPAKTERAQSWLMVVASPRVLCAKMDKSMNFIIV